MHKEDASSHGARNTNVTLVVFVESKLFLRAPSSNQCEHSSHMQCAHAPNRYQTRVFHIAFFVPICRSLFCLSFLRPSILIASYTRCQIIQYHFLALVSRLLFNRAHVVASCTCRFMSAFFSDFRFSHSCPDQLRKSLLSSTLFLHTSKLVISYKRDESHSSRTRLIALFYTHAPNLVQGFIRVGGRGGASQACCHQFKAKPLPPGSNNFCTPPITSSIVLRR